MREGGGRASERKGVLDIVSDDDSDEKKAETVLGKFDDAEGKVKRKQEAVKAQAVKGQVKVKTVVLRCSMVVLAPSFVMFSIQQLCVVCSTNLDWFLYAGLVFVNKTLWSS